MKKKASLFRHLFLSKNFILMLVMLVVVIITVSAWFTVHKTVSANTMLVKAESSEIDIAPCIKTYDGNWEVLTDGPGVFGTTVEFSAPEDFGSFSKDCTGDGEDLIVPDFNVTSDYDHVRQTTGKEVNINVSGKSAFSQEYSRIESLKHPDQDPPEYQYLEFEFYARSKNPALLLAAESAVKADTEVNNGDLYATLDAGAPKRSAYGNFNVDALVGAVRVSLLGEPCSTVTQTWKPTTGDAGQLDENHPPTTERSSDNMVKQILWYPRPEIKLNIPPNEGDITNWTIGRVDSNDNSFTNTYYKNNAGTDGLTLVDPDTDSKTVVSPAVSTGIPTLGQNVNISDFPNVSRNKVSLVVDAADRTVTEEYYVTKYTLRVWIEGTDFEARRAMDGGKFNLTLKLL